MSEVKPSAATDHVNDASGTYRTTAHARQADSRLARSNQAATSDGHGEWTKGKLGDVVSRLVAGVSVNSVPSDLGSATLPSVLKTSCVAEGRFDPGEAKVIAPEDLNRTTSSPAADSILISRMNTPDLVGESGYVPKDYPSLFLPDRLWMTVFRRDADLSVRWLSYVLSSREYRDRLKELATGTSGSMKNISKGSLLALELLLPPMAEQRAIAAALSDADALIDALDRLIAKKRAIKQATQQQLLTGQTRLPGFMNEWKTARLGDLGRFRGGSGFPTSRQGMSEGKYPFFKVSDMNNSGNEWLMSTANNYINEDVRSQIGATVFPANSVIFAKVGAAIFLERKRLLMSPCCLDNNVAAYIFDDSIFAPKFVYYFFCSISLGDLVSTTALPSLSNGVLSAIVIRLPDVDEQTAIATVLTDMDAEIEALQHRRDKARQIKQGMMQQLLTGRVRLV